MNILIVLLKNMFTFGKKVMSCFKKFATLTPLPAFIEYLFPPFKNTMLPACYPVTHFF